MRISLGRRRERRARRWHRGLCWIPAGALALEVLACAPHGMVAVAAVASAAPQWHSCPDAAGFQCASVRVPLDYARPGGEKIEVALIRHLATHPAKRTGSVVFNPGGPGGPGTIVLPLFYNLLPAAVRDQYDIVSFDPRGVGRSNGLACFTSQDEENRALGQWADGFPVGAAQITAWNRAYQSFDEQCTRNGGAVMSHMSTADVARDMDAIRRTLGERQLNYYGISYGAVLGATYANLFPSRVGRMVLDGNVSPVAWADGDANVPTGLRMGSDSASANTLQGFLTLCGNAPVSDCTFSAGSPAATTAKYKTLLQRLLKRPVTVESQPYTYASTVSVVDEFLYTTRSEQSIGQMGWQAGAQLLESIWQASAHPGASATAAPSAAPTSSSATASASASGTDPAADSEPYNGIEQLLGVECADSPNPADPAAYAQQASKAARTSGAFSPMWAYRTEPCSSWPANGADRYTGPWNRPTANPILVVGNTGDPATPYDNSVAMSQALARGRLLTIDEYGHTLAVNPNACGSGYVTRYLLTGALPPAGATCGQEGQPFAAAGAQR